MKINEEVKDLLRECNIPVHDGLGYLVSLYYDLKVSYIPTELEERIKRCSIFEADDKSYTIKWNLPLFEDQITEFDWIVSWMDEFSSRNKDRRGSKSSVMSRMKKFFITYPDVRKQDVISATRFYMASIENPKFLKKSEKFIFEGIGLEKMSLLKEWVDKYKEVYQEKDDRTSSSVTMK